MKLLPRLAVHMSRTKIDDVHRKPCKQRKQYTKAKQRLIKAKGELTGEEKLDVILGLACGPYVYNPVSTETELMKATVHMCENLCLQDTSFALVPAHIGRHVAVDSAVAAVVHARATLRNGNTSLRTQKYLNAVGCVRESLQTAPWCFSDDAILGIFLLEFYERLMGPNIYIDQTASGIHKQAIAAILLTRSQRCEGEISESMRSMLYQAWSVYVWHPCMHGTASPFDHTAFLQFDPPEHYNLRPELTKLSRTSMNVMIRVPALIAESRRFRQGLFEVNDPEEFALTAATREVMGWTDVAAESAALHKVQVIKSSPTSSILPCSLRYRDINELKANIRYWIARILICRLWLKLRELGGGVETLHDTEDHAKAECGRMLTNVIMSWEHFKGLGPHGHTIMGPSLAVAWGVLADSDRFRGGPASRFRAWVLKQLVDPQIGME